MKNQILEQLNKRPCAVPVLLRSGDIDFLIKEGEGNIRFAKSQKTLDSYQNDLLFNGPKIPSTQDIMKIYPAVIFKEGERANWIRKENKEYVRKFFEAIQKRKEATEAEQAVKNFSEKEISTPSAQEIENITPSEENTESAEEKIEKTE